MNAAMRMTTTRRMKSSNRDRRLARGIGDFLNHENPALILLTISVERETGLEPTTFCLENLYAKEIVEWRSKLL